MTRYTPRRSGLYRAMRLVGWGLPLFVSIVAAVATAFTYITGKH